MSAKNGPSSPTPCRIGRAGPAGSWQPILDCAEWREAINDGDYDYVVTTYDERFPGEEDTSREREWIRRDPAAAELVMTINGGNRTVPTVVYGDGSAHTNPPLKVVLGKLAELQTA